MLQNPDPAKAWRTMEALTKMVPFDIQALQQQANDG